jgi:hypothetical protein
LAFVMGEGEIWIRYTAVGLETIDWGMDLFELVKM